MDFFILVFTINVFIFFFLNHHSISMLVLVLRNFISNERQQDSLLTICGSTFPQLSLTEEYQILI